MLLLTATGLCPGAVATAPRGASEPTVPGLLSGTLQIGPLVAHPYGGFWSVVLQGGHLLNSTLAAAFNATPFVLIRYGGGVDESNVSNGCTYTDSGVCGRLKLNYSNFATFCGWVRCRSILGVPGEPDDPGLAADTVRYVERTIGFTPTFWSIGNEPEAWTHFGIPLPHWRTSDRSTPTGLAYATAVGRLSKAIRSVDPHAEIIGDQDAQTGSVLSFYRELALLDNGAISAVAFHSYPGRRGPPVPNVAGFLSRYDVSRTAYYLALDRAAYDLACGCEKSVMVGEFNGALVGGSYDRYLDSYPDVPLTAATAAELLTANASIFSFFSFWGGQPYDLINAFTGAVNPTYDLFAQLLSYLPMGATRAVTVTTPVGGVYAVEELSNATGAGLLLVNTNTTASLSIPLGGWFGTGKGDSIADTFSGGVHRTAYLPGRTPGSVVLPPEGVTLLLRGAAAP